MQTHFLLRAHRVCRMHLMLDLWILAFLDVWPALTVQVLTCSALPARVGTAPSLWQVFVKSCRNGLSKGLSYAFLTLRVKSAGNPRQED